MDRRLTPANGRVAAMSLQGKVGAALFTDGVALRVIVPVADLCAAPDGARDRQLLFGAEVTVLEDRDGWSFVQAVRDGYVGYMRSAALGQPQPATHHVAVPATHLYAAQDIKSPDLHALSFGSRVTVTADHASFHETPDGFVPKVHLRPLSDPFSDPVEVAQLHLGVPYLWGGNSILGIDCSGLVQAALSACGIACPGDSDMQCESLGRLVEDDAAQQGDLWFWKGHVGLLCDDRTLIHANAHHMAVAREPIAEAVARIRAQGGGDVIARKRLQG
jgi:cell wall-associated NlpC family hydrolase